MSSKTNKGKLLLIPTTLGDSGIDSVLPVSIQQYARSLKHFAVENIRSARRFLKSVDRNINIDELQFFELNKRSSVMDLEPIIKVMRQGQDLGILSEAGCPAIADPGNILVAAAHEQGFIVKPLVGPSSILLALMASGLNGQSFTFHGYVAKDRKDRIQQLKQWDRSARSTSYSQAFMDTPFRNEHVLEDILSACDNRTKLCIARDISLPEEMIKTRTISEWKDKKIDLHKRPCIFILGL